MHGYSIKLTVTAPACTVYLLYTGAVMWKNGRSPYLLRSARSPGRSPGRSLAILAALFGWGGAIPVIGDEIQRDFRRRRGFRGF